MTNVIRFATCLLAGILLLGAGPTAQDRGSRVYAQLSTGVARLGEEVTVRISAVNLGRAKLVKVPTVEGLTFGTPRGPEVSSQTTMRGNRVISSNQYSWRVSLRASSEGDFEIPGFVVEVKGETRETAPLKLKVVKDMKGAELGFLEIRPSSERVVEGQPFTLELRFGWSQSLGANFADLDLPWWGELPGALEVETGDVPPSQRRVKGVLVNGTVSVICEELDPIERNGEIFRQLRLVRGYLPSRSGKLEFPTSSLEFGRSVQSRSGFFGASRNTKGERFFVQAVPFSMEVIPLPTEGQPFDFTGAVGTLAVRSGADTRDVLVGDSIKLVVDWTGSGNLEFFDPPDLSLLDRFRPFRVYGSTEEKSFDRRRVIYDVAPLSDEVTEIPGVPLTVFDPVSGEYIRIESEPIPVRVRPLEGAVELAEGSSDRFGRDIRDLDTAPLPTAQAAPLPSPDDRVLSIALMGVPLLWLAVRTGVRRRRGNPDAPLERRRRGARRALARNLTRATDASTRLRAFTTFLGARTLEPEEAWLGRDARRWAEEEGGATKLSDELLGELTAILSRLEAEAFGGGPAVPSDELLRVADRLRKGGL